MRRRKASPQGKRQLQAYTRALCVLTRMRYGESLSHAARIEHIKPATARKYLGPHLRQGASGKPRNASESDRLTAEMNVSAESSLSLKMRLERIRRGELEKVRRRFSWAVLAIVAGKIGMDLGLIDPSWVVSKFPSHNLADLLLVPRAWPWWQLTLTTDAVLTVLLFFFVDAVSARLEAPRAWSGDTVLRLVLAVSFVRAVLALLTISYFLCLALLAVAPNSIYYWLI